MNEAIASSRPTHALLTDKQQVLGPNHPDTLDTRGGLAQCLWQGGRTAEAITASNQQRVLGPNHPGTVITRNNLARSLGEAGRTFDGPDSRRDLVSSDFIPPGNIEGGFGSDTRRVDTRLRRRRPKGAWSLAYRIHHPPLPRTHVQVCGPNPHLSMPEEFRSLCANHGLQVIDRGVLAHTRYPR